MAASSVLLKRSLWASLGILFSRLTGIFRIQVINALFGNTIELSAFYFAYRIPNVLRELFADGALASAFTQTLVDVEIQDNQKSNKDNQYSEILGTIFWFFSVFSLLLAFILERTSFLWMGLGTSQNFQDQGGLGLAQSLFAWVVYYLPCSTISAIGMAYLSQKGKSFWPMVGTAIFNVSMMLFVIFSHNSIADLGYAVTFAGIIQTIFLLYPLFSQQGFLIVRIKHLHYVLKIAYGMFPRIVNQGSLLISLFINSFFATSLSPTALGEIQSAQTLIQLPISLVGVAIGFVSLPLLSRHKDEPKVFEKMLNQGISLGSLLGILSVGGISFCIVPLCVVLFSYGKFRIEDSQAIARMAIAYIPAIFLSIQAKILTQSYFSLNQTKFLMLTSFLFLAINTLLNFIFLPILGIWSLGFANSVAQLFEVLILRYFLTKKYPFPIKIFKFYPYFLLAMTFYGLSFFIFNLSLTWNYNEAFKYLLAMVFLGIFIMGGLLKWVIPQFRL